MAPSLAATAGSIPIHADARDHGAPDRAGQLSQFQAGLAHSQAGQNMFGVQQSQSAHSAPDRYMQMSVQVFLGFDGSAVV